MLAAGATCIFIEYCATATRKPIVKRTATPDEAASRLLIAAGKRHWIAAGTRMRRTGNVMVAAASEFANAGLSLRTSWPIWASGLKVRRSTASTTQVTTSRTTAAGRLGMSRLVIDALDIKLPTNTPLLSVFPGRHEDGSGGRITPRDDPQAPLEAARCGHYAVVVWVAVRRHHEAVDEIEPVLDVVGQRANSD